MAPRTAQLSDPEYREQILIAALRRFFRFGYSKTTMNEIADDVHMSAANLYRFFENKQDLAAACCDRAMGERLARLRAAADRPSTVAERLEAYVLAMIEHTHEIADPDTKIGELIEIVTKERPEMIRGRLLTHYELLAEILQGGCEEDAFAIDNPAQTAKVLHSAFMLFDVPLFVGFFSREEFEARARGLVQLLLTGLRQRP